MLLRFFAFFLRDTAYTISSQSVHNLFINKSEKVVDKIRQRLFDICINQEDQELHQEDQKEGHQDC